MNKIIDKHIIIKIIVIVLVIAIVIIFAYPHNLKNIIKENITIEVIDSELEDGIPKTDINQYNIEYGSKQYKMLEQILEKKYYHRNFNSFIKNDKIHLKVIDHITIKSYDKNMKDTNYLLVYDKNKIMINNKSYTLGYFSDSSGKDLIRKIFELVSD